MYKFKSVVLLAKVFPVKSNGFIARNQKENQFLDIVDIMCDWRVRRTVSLVIFLSCADLAVTLGCFLPLAALWSVVSYHKSSFYLLGKNSECSSKC